MSNLNEIISKYIEAFETAKRDPKTKPLIENNYIPVVWFGNMNEYLKTEPRNRIITLSINPSNQEFTEPRFDSIDFSKGDRQTHISKLEETLNSYFVTNPYKDWFNDYEEMLNGIKSSYYSNSGFKNRAIHIDTFATPTNKTWKDLTEEQKNVLLPDCDLLNELIEFLNPGIVLASINSDIFDKVFVNSRLIDQYTCARNKKGEPIKNQYVYKADKQYYIRHYSYNNRIIIHGRCNSGKPFRVFDKDTRIKILNEIIEK